MTGYSDDDVERKISCPIKKFSFCSQLAQCAMTQEKLLVVHTY